MRRLLLALGVLALTACPQPASASPPSLRVAVTSAPDTVKFAVNCGAATNNAKCRIVVRDSVSNAVVASGDVFVGSALSGAIVCSAVNAHVAVSVTAFGLTAAGSQSATATGPIYGSTNCPDASATAPPITIQFTIGHGG